MGHRWILAFAAALLLATLVASPSAAELQPRPEAAREAGKIEADEGKAAKRAARERTCRLLGARGARKGKGKKQKSRRPRYCSSGGQARGDFNGDGIADLAVGVPGEDVGRTVDAGAVNVIYGKPDGLGAAGNQLWHQDRPGILGDVTAFDQFGSALAAGDFNGDGFADLAVGVPGEDVSGRDDAGSVNVIHGTASGLAAANNQVWTQDSAGIDDLAEAGDRFGSSLVWANFGFSANADLAIGAPFEDLGGAPLGTGNDAGAVHVLYSAASTSGLTSARSQLWTLLNVEGFSEAGARFGAPLAGGDFDGNGFADLVIGIPFDDDSRPDPQAQGQNITSTDAGRVRVIYGSGFGLQVGEAADAFFVPRSQVWRQNAESVEGTGENGDLFGAALASGDFTGDSKTDLAVGVPSDDDGFTDSGRVHVIPGSTTGLSDANQVAFRQGVNTEHGDAFGAALAAAELTGDGKPELVIGAPLEDHLGKNDAGGISILLGGGTGFIPLIHQDSPGVPDEVEPGDQFGAALSGWDFGKGAPVDLAVAAPLENLQGVADAGAVSVLYGPFDLAGVPLAKQVWHQNSTNILEQADVSDTFGSALY